MEHTLKVFIVVVGLSVAFCSKLEDNQDDNRGLGFSCKGKQGFHANPEDCGAFIRCVYGRPFHFKCPEGLKFNVKESSCDWPRNVKCGEFCEHRDDGIYADPETCEGFIHCAHRRTFHKDCPAGTLFNPNLKVCDWPHNVECNIGSGSGSGDGAEF